MKLSTEYLPALNAARQDLVLLHGWSMNREVWRPLLAALRPWANVTLVDVPGCSISDAPGFDGRLSTLISALLEQMPQRAVYIGWSLGGQVATLVSAQAPARVEALVTLCANPRFVAEDNWPGMQQALFADFRTTCQRDAAGGLRRFDALQSQVGDALNRPRLKQLSMLRSQSHPGEQLAFGLDWLADLDTRPALASLSVPQLHLLGGADSLIPVALAKPLRQALDGQPSSQVEVLEDASHVVVLDDPEGVATRIEAFLDRVALLHSVAHPHRDRNKEEVAASFSSAAETYDSVAALQRDVGHSLLNRSPATLPENTQLLDLGSGTGYFCAPLRERYPQARYLGLDLAEGMVDYARRCHPGAGSWLVGDAEALPLATASIDFVFSSLAIQWSDRADLLLAELARVLKPGGRCLFTTLGPETLRELRDAWAAVDSHQHVNRFLSPDDLVDAARGLTDVTLALENQSFVMRYDKVAELLRELKALGAHNMNDGRPAGLTSRRKLSAMFSAYETYRESAGLPASYDVLFGTLEKQ